MKKKIFISTIIVSMFSIGGLAYACDLHGGGYSLRNANWQPYNPIASTIDPAFTNPAFAEAEFATPWPVSPAKPKPNFSNAANLAATKAKARLSKKKDSKKPLQDADVKKTVLNADR